MKNPSSVELEDIIYGCGILGTGGGGGLKEGIDIIKNLGKSKKIRIAKIKELKSDDLVGSPYYCGSVSPEGEDGVSGEVALYALESLEKYLDTEFQAVIAAELGSLATAGAFAVAFQKDIPILDADVAGRAVPDLQCSLFYVNDVPITPMGVATKGGDRIIVKQVRDDIRAEDIVRTIAVASDDMVGVCDHPAKLEVVKEAVVPDTISLAGRIGRARRKAVKDGKDACKAVAEAGKGFLLFTGTVSKHEWRKVEGFTVGGIRLTGTGKHSGDEYEIHYKNENLVALRNGEVEVIIPDLICVLEKDTGKPITNPNCHKGQKVAVIGYPAYEQWRTNKGMATFGPQFADYDMEYIPIEKRMG